MADLHQHLNLTHQGALAKRISVTRVTAEACDYESPKHEHAQGQLVLALAGGVRCAINGQVWMVPPQGAVWIPPHQSHTNYVTHNAEVCMAFIAVDAGLADMPAGTLAVSPLLRELVLQLAAGKSVQQVSMDLGYESVSAFITVFKKRLGTTPKRYFSAEPV